MTNRVPWRVNPMLTPVVGQSEISGLSGRGGGASAIFTNSIAVVAVLALRH